MGTVGDDEIIRRRLLIEGDGGGDDRRITTLLKSFIKWSTVKDSEEDSYGTYQKMIAMLAQCEFAMDKTHLVYDMNLKEQKNYEELNQQIETNISEAVKKIKECKLELQEAKRIRKNRQEYDALAKVIQQHPDRQETFKQLETLDKELETLKKEQQDLDDKLVIRKKQFHLLISAIHQLQSIFEEEDKNENEVEEEKEMDMS
ncbi:THO complex subunit 7 homolog [Tubulanus polymorphus]|uniref:THO complex subunit 7 homolog n=1 Tax=Tubulanus polymorphus TaxID=672921 RepID=UPI003DA5593B